MRLTNKQILESRAAFIELLSPGKSLPPRLGYAIDRTVPRIEEAFTAIERSEARLKEPYIEERIRCIVDKGGDELAVVRDLEEDEEPELEPGQEIGDRLIYTDPDALADELEELYLDETEVEVHQVFIDYLDEKDFWLPNEVRAPLSFLFTDSLE